MNEQNWRNNCTFVDLFVYLLDLTRVFFQPRDEEEGQPHSKKELIELAKEIATASKEIVKLGQRACEKCNDKRLKSVRKDLFFFVKNNQ